MSEHFSFDVFLSHSSKDKAVVRSVAERLRADGLRVWFDDWEIRVGDSIPAKIEEGLERSRVLVLCMSANAFGSDWAQLEAGTFRFRDPLNRERRFIPLRLDSADVKGSLRQFSYLDWSHDSREAEYQKLLDACRQSTTELTSDLHPAFEAADQSAPGRRVEAAAADQQVTITKYPSGSSLNFHITNISSPSPLTGCELYLLDFRGWSETVGSFCEVDGLHRDGRFKFESLVLFADKTDLYIDTPRCFQLIDGTEHAKPKVKGTLREAGAVIRSFYLPRSGLWKAVLLLQWNGGRLSFDQCFQWDGLTRAVFADDPSVATRKIQCSADDPDVFVAYESGSLYRGLYVENNIEWVQPSNDQLFRRAKDKA